MSSVSPRKVTPGADGMLSFKAALFRDVLKERFKCGIFYRFLWTPRKTPGVDGSAGTTTYFDQHTQAHLFAESRDCSVFPSFAS